LNEGRGLYESVTPHTFTTWGPADHVALFDGVDFAHPAKLRRLPKPVEVGSYIFLDPGKVLVLGKPEEVAQ
jgi:hypothetical protein